MHAATARRTLPSLLQFLIIGLLYGQNLLFVPKYNNHVVFPLCNLSFLTLFIHLVTQHHEKVSPVHWESSKYI